ncbi:MAG: hypothetical protein WAL84_10545 [Candidatus Dormiibacterota bacterium]
MVTDRTDQPELVPEHRYLLSVAELNLGREWLVGRVRLHPKGTTRALIAEQRQAAGQGGPDWYLKYLDERVEHFDEFTVAEVSCSDAREAYGHVADALAVVRLLQHMRAPMVDTDEQTFGLPGETSQWRMEYIDLLAGPAGGWFSGGVFPGWEFTDTDYEAFQNDPGLQFLSVALAKDSRSRLEQRAVLGVRLLSTSTLQDDPDLKLLAAVMALEVLIGDDREVPKKFRLARRHAFLACSVPQKSMCGRDRPSCPYIALDPDNKTDGNTLKALRTRAAAGETRVLCSEYLHMIALYDARNAAVHDGSVGADLKAVRNALYRFYRWLVPQVYAWYADHPSDDDLGQLDEEIVRVTRLNPPPPLPSPGS